MDLLSNGIEAIRSASEHSTLDDDADALPEYRWVLLTPPNQGFLWHQDPYHTTAWNVHLGGAPKRWVFREPSAKTHLRGNVESRTAPFATVQRAGEAILIPSMWWHHT